MSKVIGIQFQQNGKMFYYDPNGIEAEAGQYVVADTDRGIDLGVVVMPPRELDDRVQIENLRKVVRMASQQDIQHATDNRAKEREACSVCQTKIAEHKLEMKLVSVEYAFDNSKILFFFTANGRVDFRSLVKDLASIFKMRIELRQIGVRDEAKMLGGLGPCGRTICCGSFLDQFQPVSIKMAKEQNLSLNPTKISGVCGRLMCCLKYEQEHYEQTRKKMPKVGKTVTTPDGSGPVTDLNIVKETVFVRLADGDSSEIKEYPLEMITGTDQGIYHESIQKDNNQNTQNDTESVQLSEQSEKTTDNNQEDSAEAIRHEAKATTQKNRHRQKGKTQRNQQLGQPVRRENPNRMIAVQEGNNDSVTSNNIASNQNVEVTQNTSPWADALQKAIRAIQSDN